MTVPSALATRSKASLSKKAVVLVRSAAALTYAAIHVFVFGVMQIVAIVSPAVLGYLAMLLLNEVFGNFSGAFVPLVGGIIASFMTLGGLIKTLEVGLSADLPGSLVAPDELNEFSATISRKIGMKPFDEIRITATMEAATLYAGRKRILVIGLLLLKYLTKEELGAVIAHEYGHHQGQAMLLNRVHYRAFMFMRGFYKAMLSRHQILTALDFGPLSDSAGVMMFPQIFVLRAYSALLNGLGYLLNQPRYEFYCDRVAAETFGSLALISAFHKLTRLSLALHISTNSTGVGQEWLQSLDERLQGSNDEEIQRAELEPSDTHPPIALRIIKLQQLDLPGAVVTEDGNAPELRQHLVVSATVDKLWLQIQRTRDAKVEDVAETRRQELAPEYQEPGARRSFSEAMERYRKSRSDAQ